MALTGLGFCLFLAVHLIGNLFIYGGQDLFHAYVDHLHALGPIIYISEIGLLILLGIHLTMAITLYFQNLTARPVTYVKKRSAGGRTLASGTMPYTGLLILIFLIVHLITFKFADHSKQTVFEIVSSTFIQPEFQIMYVIAMIVVGLHVNHGFWSAFQTLGLDHPKYMPTIKTVSIVYSLIIIVGFGFIPIYIMMLSFS
ncbi:MAG: Succinate dehydrogenase cytochrome b subunit [Candidatus Magnetoglobus multicellularis str. Araruama]|uniref:Succinate dehydrogenase cytochrome b subunit n=1 Tax=Candidatus Magnetoglobus multicellularis str. Araruama TaxID=890399 RepID=A0A1V1PIV5_9BACT|nr:MAG: Succinate dehydrogenase cytochrome b subunit [Candidatus Magnetoglobus multicellularis str. Araruama]